MPKHNSSSPSFYQHLLQLIHLHVSIVIAPFIFIVALTGVLYGLTPQLEQVRYHDYLVATPSAQHPIAQPLSQQVAQALPYLPDNTHIMAVRPASNEHTTTRVIYMDNQNNQKTIAIFINPYTLQYQGQLPVYGTSGVLPLRIALDQLHRNLYLGAGGRIYSELAASWLGIFAITGFIHWRIKVKKSKKQRPATPTFSQQLHIYGGLLVFPMLLFFSITGLTWSNWTGANIAKLRHAIHSDTPMLNTQLHAQAEMNMDEHAEHQRHAMQMTNMPMHHQPEKLDLHDFDRIVTLAKQHGLQASALQITPNQDSAHVWKIEEIQHHWPIRIDALAVNMHNQQIIDHISFQDFPLSAKLTRWGVDLHIGVLFGWFNQLILVLSGFMILLMVGLGYKIWWQHAHLQHTFFHLYDAIRKSVISATPIQRMTTAMILICLYFLVPIWVLSIVFFLIYAFLYKQCIEK